MSELENVVKEIIQIGAVEEKKSKRENRKKEKKFHSLWHGITQQNVGVFKV